jgi:hypothetical protein
MLSNTCYILIVLFHFIIIRQQLSSTKDDVITVKHALMEHGSKVIKELDEDVQRITVRRSNLLTDSFRIFSRSKTDLTKRLKVVFLGEASVDEGGPRREFFQLLLKEIFVDSGLLAVWPAKYYSKYQCSCSK